MSPQQPDFDLIRDLGDPIFGLVGREPTWLSCPSQHIDDDRRRSALIVEAQYGDERRPKSWRLVGTHIREPALDWIGCSSSLALAEFSSMRGRLQFPLRIEIEPSEQRFSWQGTVVDGDAWRGATSWLAVVRIGGRWCSVFARAGDRPDLIDVVTIDLDSLPRPPEVDLPRAPRAFRGPSAQVHPVPVGLGDRNDFVVGGSGGGHCKLLYGIERRFLEITTSTAGQRLRTALQMLLMHATGRNPDRRDLPGVFVIEREHTTVRVLGRKRACARYRCGPVWLVNTRVGDRYVSVVGEEPYDAELELAEIDPRLLQTRIEELRSKMRFHYARADRRDERGES